ncbi:MarR family winged helix-turn-helix transcriptional regulator (plasmid) [Streptomyces sp. NBC_00841]|uniref:MarR family winged helix-turn-helix transcriptional regulator n=1 Tax=Streptomyces sp. NBC_00841 TaxID=2975847 RepID=UPI002DDA6079|nr:MarR family winged helix-turn-helix transcriptional regulator [Streptomyces sp. NBC_00841]WSA06089.1 MarR family winged helix-turn-helix transcriptional regulator [Streptomyces sp. NBC_00841]
MEQHESTTTGSAPEQVGLSFLTLAYSLRERVDQRMLATAGLSLSRTKVLQALAGRGALHQAELAASLGQAPRSVTQIVEGLERLGMVVRTGDSEDRRRKTVSLTDAGRTALAAAEQAGTNALRQCFGLLEPHQLATLDALLTYLDTALTGDKNG